MSDISANMPKRRGRKPRTLADLTAKLAKPEPVEANMSVESAPVTDRPAMRPPMREEDPRAAAARRAAEIRGHIGNMDEGPDKFLTPNAPDEIGRAHV